MEPLRLDFHGVAVDIQTHVARVREQLRRDFSLFEQRGEIDSYAPVRIEVRVASPDPGRLPRVFPEFVVRGATVYDAGRERWIDYRGAAQALYVRASGRVEIEADTPGLAHELAYLAVLSRVGEKLDAKGMHRVHALGFTLGAGAGLVLGAGGAGKSRLAYELLKREGFGLLSDDTPLVSAAGEAVPFPLRLGFRLRQRLPEVPEKFTRLFHRRHYPSKKLVDADWFAERVGPPSPVKWLFVLRPGAGAPRIEPLGRARVLAALARDLVVGDGVAQMSEYMIELSAAGVRRLSGYARARWRLARRLAALPAFEFRVGADFARNAEALESFLIHLGP